jgi:hypothetical protein
MGPEDWFIWGAILVFLKKGANWRFKKIDYSIG